MILAASAPAAVGQTTVDDGSAYDVRWPVDLTVTGVAGAVWLAPQFFTGALVSPSCPCDRGSVPGFDRVALDRSSAEARLAGDVTVTALLVVPAGLHALDLRRRGGTWTGFAKDMVVVGQAVLVNGALNELVKLAVRRPRPLTYDTADAAVLSKNDNYLSFYSSHTSTAFAAGMAYATTYAIRHPDGGGRYVAYGAAVALGSGTGLTRILAGKHFPSDVLTGAIVGSAIGLGIPWLHRRKDREIAIYPAGAGFVLQGRF